MAKKGFDPKDKAILEFLYFEGDLPATVQEIAEATNLTWPTVKKRLSGLKRGKYVKQVNRENKVLWKFNHKKQENPD